MTDPKCKDMVGKELKDRIDDIRKLWELEKSGDENGDPDIGTFNEYGLCLDYVAPGTFEGQRRGYFRYQLSTGGPGDEFRFFCDENLNPVRIEYWFLDWYDGAKKILSGKNEELMLEIFEMWKECGTIEHLKNEATK